MRFRVDNTVAGITAVIVVDADPGRVDLDTAQSLLTSTYAAAFVALTERYEKATQ